MMHHTIEIRDDVAWVICEGRQTVEDMSSALDALLSHESFRPGMACLWDSRGLTHSSVSADEVAGVAARFKPFRDLGEAEAWLRTQSD